MMTLEDELDSFFNASEVRSIEIGMAERFARNRHENYDAMVSPVFHLMANDPELRRQLLSQTDIAESCYRYGKEQGNETV